VRRFVVRRLAQAVLVVFGVSLVVFCVVRLSGDPTYLMLSPNATEEDRRRERQAKELMFHKLALLH
jgi:peptide/nickel transport system permease protein